MLSHHAEFRAESDQPGPAEGAIIPKDFHQLIRVAAEPLHLVAVSVARKPQSEAR
jgi:hypothetical protein